MSLSTVSLGDENKVWLDDTGKSLAYFCRDLPAKVDRDVLEELKTNARQRGDNARICLHDSPQSLFHSMIVLEWGGKYRRPHLHRDKGETYHIIEGSMAVFTFSEKGEIIDSCILDIQGKNIIYRVQANSFHCAMPLSEYVIFHESRTGPFAGGDSIFPSWAPEGQNENNASAYMDKLKKALG